MILYLDASAIVKKYVSEPGSAEVQIALKEAAVIGTTVLSRAEVIAALRKAARMAVIDEPDAATALRAFNKSWRDLVRTRITERLVKYAGELAWNHGLRGYGAVHLASAAAWQQAFGETVTLATFDLKLWKARVLSGSPLFPMTFQSGEENRFGSAVATFSEFLPRVIVHIYFGETCRSIAL